MGARAGEGHAVAGNGGVVGKEVGVQGKVGCRAEPARPRAVGDDMSMEAIQDYIAQLQNLHERSAQLASSGGGEPASESPLLMGD